MDPNPNGSQPPGSRTLHGPPKPRNTPPPSPSRALPGKSSTWPGSRLVAKPAPSMNARSLLEAPSSALCRVPTRDARPKKPTKCPAGRHPFAKPWEGRCQQGRLLSPKRTARAAAHTPHAAARSLLPKLAWVIDGDGTIRWQCRTDDIMV